MTRMLSGILRPKHPGQPRLALGVFGKHPGWLDHISAREGTDGSPERERSNAARLGLEHERIRVVRKLLYEDAIRPLVENGTWTGDNILDGYSHAFAWYLGDQTVIGRLWTSRDGAFPPRTWFPMVACVETSGMEPGAATRFLSNRLTLVEQDVRAVETSESLMAVLDRERASLPQWATSLSDASQKTDGLTLSEASACLDVLGPDRVQLHRIVAALEREAGPVGSPSKPRSTVRIRVPMVMLDPGVSLAFWHALIRHLYPTLDPLVLCCRHDEGFVDVFLGQPTSLLWECLRFSKARLPLSSDIPYPVDAQGVRRFDAICDDWLQSLTPSASVNAPPQSSPAQAPPPLLKVASQPPSPPTQPAPVPEEAPPETHAPLLRSTPPAGTVQPTSPIPDSAPPLTPHPPPPASTTIPIHPAKPEAPPAPQSSQRAHETSAPASPTGGSLPLRRGGVDVSPQGTCAGTPQTSPPATAARRISPLVFITAGLVLAGIVGGSILLSRSDPKPAVSGTGHKTQDGTPTPSPRSESQLPTDLTAQPPKADSTPRAAEPVTPTLEPTQPTADLLALADTLESLSHRVAQAREADKLIGSSPETPPVLDAVIAELRANKATSNEGLQAKAKAEEFLRRWLGSFAPRAAEWSTMRAGEVCTEHNGEPCRAWRDSLSPPAEPRDPGAALSFLETREKAIHHARSIFEWGVAQSKRTPVDQDSTSAQKTIIAAMGAALADPAHSDTVLLTAGEEVSEMLASHERGALIAQMLREGWLLEESPPRGSTLSALVDGPGAENNPEVENLLKIERANPTLLREVARAAPPSTLSAKRALWVRLGDLEGWPGDESELRLDMTALRNALTGADQHKDNAHAASVARDLRLSAPARWSQAALLAFPAGKGHNSTLTELLARTSTLDAYSLARPPEWFDANLALARLRLALSDEQTADRASLTAAVDIFEVSAASAWRETTSQLRATIAASSVAPLGDQGPGSKGWSMDPTSPPDGSWVRYNAPGASGVVLTFRRVGDSLSFVQTDLFSVGAVAELARITKDGPAQQRVSAILANVRPKYKDICGPCSWVPSNNTVLVAPSWFPAENCGVKISGVPSTLSPMNYVSAQAAKDIAKLVGCRLSTVSESGRCEGDGDGSRWTIGIQKGQVFRPSSSTEFSFSFESGIPPVDETRMTFGRAESQSTALREFAVRGVDTPEATCIVGDSVAARSVSKGPFKFDSQDWGGSDIGFRLAFTAKGAPKSNLREEIMALADRLEWLKPPSLDKP